MADVTTTGPAVAARWAGAACTVDGRPAVVTGRGGLPFAVVALRDGSARYAFPWATVARVMAGAKAFAAAV